MKTENGGECRVFRFKKFIAREGLVLLAVLAGSGFFFVGHVWQAIHVSTHLKYPESKIAEVLAKTKRVDELTVICPNGKQVKFDSPPTSVDIFEACQTTGSVQDLSSIPDKQLLDIAGVPRRERSLFQRINFLSISIFFLFIAYPFYWIGKFILWALKTLRSGN